MRVCEGVRVWGRVRWVGPSMRRGGQGKPCGDCAHSAELLTHLKDTVSPHSVTTPSTLTVALAALAVKEGMLAMLALSCRMRRADSRLAGLGAPQQGGQGAHTRLHGGQGGTCPRGQGHRSKEAREAGEGGVCT